MKKTFTVLLIVILTFCLTLFGCSKNISNDSSTEEGSTDEISGESSNSSTASEGSNSSENTTDWAVSTAESGSDMSTSSSSGGGGETSTTTGEVTVISTAKYQNMTFTKQAVTDEYMVDSSWKVQDLGVMELDGYPLDTVYDWGHSIIKVGDTYKMWWTRACPYDTIWYAESTDMKHWTNCQMVIKITENTEWIKEMLGWSDVLYVDGKYYMYFEAPCRIGSSSEYGNNVFLAMSDDGINWTMYPNNANPVPVIKSPVIQEGTYGVGQPDAFYKDGYFYIAYTDSTGSGDCTRLAVSEQNKPWVISGSVSEHQKIINIAGASVRYNSVTNKYYCAFAVNPNLFFSSMYRNSNIYVMETDNLASWPFSDITTAVKNLSPMNTTDVYQRSNVDFAVNSEGIIDTETMYLIYKRGEMPDDNVDHRSTNTTWDGYVMAVLPSELTSSTITLPNGNASSASTLEDYATNVATWTRPSVEAANATPAIDGVEEDLWNNSTTANVETVTANWSTGCSPTDTTAEAKFLWDSNYLYVYADVKDSVVSYSAELEKPENLWRRDGVCVYIDVNNTMTGGSDVTLTPMSYVVTLCADGSYIIKDNRDSSMLDEFDTPVITSVTMTSTGYAIEAAIPWYYLVESQITSGKEIALDVSINDDQGSGDRDSIIFWSDYLGESFEYLDRFGSCLLK